MFSFFSISDEEALNGAGEAHVVGVAERIQGLEHQLAMLTQMVQTGVKLESMATEDWESVKTALNQLDGGHVFNEAVASQYYQAKQQQLHELEYNADSRISNKEIVGLK